jgi:hypothetical protein
MRNTKELKKKWSAAISKILVGKTIKSIRYLTDQEQEQFDWLDSAVVIIFTDGSWIIPMSDDEGNNAGAIQTSDPKLETIPVI